MNLWGRGGGGDKNLVRGVFWVDFPVGGMSNFFPVGEGLPPVVPPKKCEKF